MIFRIYNIYTKWVCVIYLKFKWLPCFFYLQNVTTLNSGQRRQVGSSIAEVGRTASTGPAQGVGSQWGATDPPWRRTSTRLGAEGCRQHLRVRPDFGLNRHWIVTKIPFYFSRAFHPTPSPEARERLDVLGAKGESSGRDSGCELSVTSRYKCDLIEVEGEGQLVSIYPGAGIFLFAPVFTFTIGEW